jgi:hypothetical protein
VAQLFCLSFSAWCKRKAKLLLAIQKSALKVIARRFLLDSTKLTHANFMTGNTPAKIYQT